MAVRQDARAGLPREKVGSRDLTRYDPDLALQICERVAEGETLKSICIPKGMPARQTFNRWVVNNSTLDRAYRAARALSAHSIEEEALDMARAIRDMRDAKAQEVRAYEVAMNQMRWSAARRNPAEFSDRASIKLTVPVQINTSIDLADDASAMGNPNDPGTYTITATVEHEVEGKALPEENLMKPNRLRARRSRAGKKT